MVYGKTGRRFVRWLVAVGLLAQAAAFGADVPLAITEAVQTGSRESLQFHLTQALLEDGSCCNTAYDWVSLAEIYFGLGEWSTGDQQRYYFEEARAAALRAQAEDPGNAAAYYWEAVSRGRLGQLGSLIQRLAAVEPMYSALETALALDAYFPFVHLALSMLYREAPGWPLSIGSSQKSLQFARSALELCPDDPEFIWNYVEALAAHGKDEEALNAAEILIRSDQLQSRPGLEEKVRHFLGGS